jgi:hypothetical protein
MESIPRPIAGLKFSAQVFCSRRIWVKGEHLRGIAHEKCLPALKIYLRHGRSFAFLSVCVWGGGGPVS